jgi:hypothetical protein
MRLPGFAIDEMLDDLASDQRHQLQRAAEMAGLHDRMRRWLTARIATATQTRRDHRSRGRRVSR